MKKGVLINKEQDISGLPPIPKEPYNKLREEADQWLKGGYYDIFNCHDQNKDWLGRNARANLPFLPMSILVDLIEDGIRSAKLADRKFNSTFFVKEYIPSRHDLHAIYNCDKNVMYELIPIYFGCSLPALIKSRL